MATSGRRALGEALGRRALEAVRAVADALAEDDRRSGASEEFIDRRDATVHLGTLIVARWLITGEEVRPEEAEWIGRQGEAAAEAGVPIAVRTRGYLIWRDTLILILRQEAGSLTLARGVLQEAIAMVRASCDASLIWMGRAFDAKHAELQGRLVHLSLHDPLTGLANRRLFDDRLRQAIRSAARNQGRVGVLVLDLDGFKGVNDRHGHSAGDVLLQQVAVRCRGSLRASDTVARLRGDEFGFLLSSVAGQEQATEVARKLVEAVRRPFSSGRARVRLGASIGIAVYPDHGADADRLLAAADTAMYAAKRAGRGWALAGD